MSVEQAKQLFEVIFDKDESICCTLASKGVSVSPPAARYSSHYSFFSINPLAPDMDNNPHRAFHDPSIPRRDDENVVAYRNFLFESDEGSIDEQKAKINNIFFEKGFPITSITFSGSKSLHILVSLEKPLNSDIEYRTAWKRMHAWLKEEGLLCDRSTSNPSRLSRYPGSIRQETGNVQELLFVGQRIPEDRFNKFIESCPDVKPFTIDADAENHLDSAMGQYLTSFGVNPKTYGASRRVTMWTIGKSLLESGAPEAVIEYMMKELNESWDEDKLTEEMLQERLHSILRR